MCLIEKGWAYTPRRGRMCRGRRSGIGSSRYYHPWDRTRGSDPRRPSTSDIAPAPPAISASASRGLPPPLPRRRGKVPNLPSLRRSRTDGEVQSAPWLGSRIPSSTAMWGFRRLRVRRRFFVRRSCLPLPTPPP